MGKTHKQTKKTSGKAGKTQQKQEKINLMEFFKQSQPFKNDNMDQEVNSKMKKMSFKNMSEIFKPILTQLVKDSLKVTEQSNRKTITAMDVIYASKDLSFSPEQLADMLIKAQKLL